MINTANIDNQSSDEKELKIFNPLSLLLNIFPLRIVIALPKKND